MNDSVPGPLAEIRRYTRFRAYPDGGFDPSEMTYDSRLIGRSVWNTRWLLIIPGHSLYLREWKDSSTVRLSRVVMANEPAMELMT
ncbi:MAG: hypothetical protein ACYSUP_01445 [Planctomycetota bacterium]|jgi:hypothetical protein